MEAVDVVSQNVAPKTCTERAHCEGQNVATVRGFCPSHLIDDGRICAEQSSKVAARER